EDDLLGPRVELHRRVTARADAQRRSPCLGATEWEHRPAHAGADASEDLEPLARTDRLQCVWSGRADSVETLRRLRRRRSTTMVIRYGCCIAHTRSISCGMGIECGCSMPSMTSASATWSGSSVLSWRLSCSRLSRMSSSRRRPPRLSESPGCTIGASLLCDGADESSAHFEGTVEL